MSVGNDPCRRSIDQRKERAQGIAGYGGQTGRTQHRIRLIDIDAPELGQAFGKRSRQSLAQMCAGQLARVAWRAKDRYQRILGRVACGGIDANAEQVRRGMAWVFVRYALKDSPLYGRRGAS